MKYNLEVNSETSSLSVVPDEDGGLTVTTDSRTYRLVGRRIDRHHLALEVDGARVNAFVSGEGDARQVARPGKTVGRLVVVDSEFVSAPPGRDVRVGLGIDVGVDAERYARGLAGLAGERVQEFKLRLGLHIEAADVVLERRGDLMGRLANA